MVLVIVSPSRRRVKDAKIVYKTYGTLNAARDNVILNGIMLGLTPQQARERYEERAGNAQLPLPPMLMFDRISEIAEAGGEYGKGLVRAVLELKPDLWFFPCHFKGDPVMPGCLGLDALWQGKTTVLRDDLRRPVAVALTAGFVIVHGALTRFPIGRGLGAKQFIPAMGCTMSKV